MNQDQTLAALRWFGSVAGAFAVGRGWVTKEQLTALLTDIPTLIGAAIPVGTLLWSILTRSDSAKIAAVTAMPEVAKVVVIPQSATSAAAQAAADDSQPKVKAA